jgi:hypothetical protein
MVARPPTRRASVGVRGRRPAQPAGARPTAIVNLQSASRPVFRNWLVYGDPGVGKTVLAGTAPKALFMTFDAEGTESARAFRSQADEIQLDTWVQTQEALDYFIHGTGCKDYEWLIPDTLSTLEEHIWAHTMGEGKKRNRNRPEFKRALGDYPVVWDTLKKFVDVLNRLPINVLYTANTMRIDGINPETEEETSKLYPLLGSTKRGDTAARICASVSLVGLLRSVKSDDGSRIRGRRLYVEETDHWVAKTRYPAMGAYINSPNVTSMAEVAKAGAPRKAAARRRPVEKES